MYISSAIGRRPAVAAPDRRADIAHLAQGCVQDAFHAKTAYEPLGDAEIPAPGVQLARRAHASRDILAHHDDPLVLRHDLLEGLVQRLAHRQHACHGPSPQ